MAKRGCKGKLTEEQRAFVISSLAQWAVPADILRNLRAAFPGVDYSERSIYELKNTAKVEIDEAREAYLADFSDIPLAYIKERVRAYKDIYDSATTNMERVAALKGMRDELEAIQIDLNIHGTAKEAEEFLSTLRRGQADSDGVQEDE